MLLTKASSSPASAPTNRISPPESCSCRPRAGCLTSRPSPSVSVTWKVAEAGAPVKFSTGLSSMEPEMRRPSLVSSR